MYLCSKQLDMSLACSRHSWGSQLLMAGVAEVMNQPSGAVVNLRACTHTHTHTHTQWANEGLPSSSPSGIPPSAFGWLLTGQWSSWVLISPRRGSMERVGQGQECTVRPVSQHSPWEQLVSGLLYLNSFLTLSSVWSLLCWHQITNICKEIPGWW